ncbi:HdeD family acid-resistance protein [Rathayibacter sp. CAU 1779]
MSSAAPERVSARRSWSDRYWIVALTRAIVALLAGGFITFDPEHSARVGLMVFGSFALLEGIVVGVGSLVLKDSLIRWLFVAQGALSVVVGIAALALNGAGLGVLLYGVSVWALLTGFAELYCGIRSRGRSESSRDWMVIGALTVVLAVVFLVIPPDSLLAVGLFGAYAVIVGVYVGIGAFTLKFGLAHGHAADDTASEKHA